MPKKVDDNHKQIVKGLRSIGATVRSTAAVGFGFPDLAVGWAGQTWLLEIKDGAKSPSQRRLTEAESVFHEEWKGHAAVVNSLDEALLAIGAAK